MIQNIGIRNRNHEKIGIPSFCTSNTFVMDALFAYAKDYQVPLLIEATCNQVNQFNGYSGMKPKDFADKIRQKAKRYGVDIGNIILGGDHLGPNPWKSENADIAMQHAKDLIQNFVEAGFTKIHLDASMACGGEAPLSFDMVADRSAQLCEVAEKYAPDADKLCYVIGTEVPVPGGETDDMSSIAITTPKRLDETIKTHQYAFANRGLDHGLKRAVAVVVQPGVDFSNNDIIHYDTAKSKKLTQALTKHKQFSFEAHSTDYQNTENLRALVADYSAILKVGPELTFKLREAIIILSNIEKTLGIKSPSHIMDTIAKVMQDNPKDWQSYYQGTQEEIEFFKIYSFSDRIRYYWDYPSVQQALQKLFTNLENTQIPISLINQYCNDMDLEREYSAHKIVEKKIQQSIHRYYQATGWVQ